MGLLRCSCQGLLESQVKIGLVLVRLGLVVEHLECLLLYNRGGMEFCLCQMGFLWGCWILFRGEIVGGQLLVL